jgi:hypothetical protein
MSVCKYRENEIGGKLDTTPAEAGPVPFQLDSLASPAFSDEERATAFHEAGHCVMLTLMGVAVGGATIVAANDYLGAFWGKGGDPKRFFSKACKDSRADNCDEARLIMPSLGEDRLETGFGAWMCLGTRESIVFLSGPLAEAKITGVEPNNRSDDYINAKNYARSIIYSDAAVESFLGYCTTEATLLLQKYWCAVTAVAELLLKHGTIDAVQIDTAISTALADNDRAIEAARRAGWRERMANAR